MTLTVPAPPPPGHLPTDVLSVPVSQSGHNPASTLIYMPSQHLPSLGEAFFLRFLPLLTSQCDVRVVYHPVRPGEEKRVGQRGISGELSSDWGAGLPQRRSWGREQSLGEGLGHGSVPSRMR